VFESRRASISGHGDMVEIRTYVHHNMRIWSYRGTGNFFVELKGRQI
jgi:hypothetical protein